MPNAKNAEKMPFFFCEFCDFKCSKKSNYISHTETNKHKRLINANAGKSEKCHTELHVCICGNTYKHMSSMCKHKKLCSLINEQNNNEDKNTNSESKDELISYLIKENQDFKGLILEVCKNFQQSNIVSCNNNTVNSHNKTFNLQVFLNETCKDAMNLSEFIDSFDLKLSDLESMGKLGFVDGISNIIIKKLNSLDVEKRPIHCSDTKRETMYIKDDDKWEKEGDDMKRIKKVITEIQTRNIKLIPKWKELYPDCILSNSKHTDKFNDICIEIMGGKGSDILQKEVKIIKKIAKEVAIDKDKF